MDFILQHFLLSLEIQYVLAFDFLNDTHIVSMPYGTNHIFLLLNKICMNICCAVILQFILILPMLQTQP